MMTSAQVVEKSANVVRGPSQDYTHPDHRTLPTYDVTPEFKTVSKCHSYCVTVNHVVFHSTDVFEGTLGLVVVWFWAIFSCGSLVSLIGIW